MDTPLLWHIPLSHFNEKVRWTLDYKRVAHRRQVLGADYLIRAWRATGRGTLPILLLDGRAIGDSTHIIAALEERYPEPPLYPGDAASRPQRCSGRCCRYPRSSTRYASSCRRICRTTAPRSYSIRPRSGWPAFTGCIADAPRKSRDDRLPRRRRGEHVSMRVER